MFSDPSRYKILILDDDEDDFFITNTYIRNIKGVNFETSWHHDYDRALKDLCEKKFDLYLVDFYLGAKTGIDFIKEAHAKGCEEPIIILTGRANPEFDAEAMHAGAVDYLIKGELDTEKLERTIRHVFAKSNSVRQLKSNERKFRHIFERSRDGIFLVLPEELVFNEANDAMSELFGYDKEQLRQLTLPDLIFSEEDKSDISRLIEKEDIIDREIGMKHSNGNRLDCILSLSRENDHLSRTFYQGILHDITELKKAEKANMRIEKSGMAERLVRTLAHEVRNPLNNINLSLEQLADEIRNEDNEMYIDIISRNSKRIETLIKELLGASRPEIVLTDTDIKLVLADTLAAANDRIALRKIRLDVDIPETPMPVRADHEQLKISFLNIIINAVEAMNDGGSLAVAARAEEGNFIISIRDNGCGIPPENLSRLFEPYFTAKKNGLGLGLAATLNIIQLHKASVEVKSAPGEGTEFTITVPKAEPAESVKVA